MKLNDLGIFEKADETAMEPSISEFKLSACGFSVGSEHQWEPPNYDLSPWVHIFPSIYTGIIKV